MSNRSTLQIGSVELPGRTVLAPMSGITDRPFREIALKCGAPVVVSEMIASEALAHGMADMRQRALAATDSIHIVQLAGREARWMEEGARHVAGNGADIIDINMGCPSKRVTTGYCGAALMRDPFEAARLVEATVKGAGDVPVTVKMRLGWDDNLLNAPEIARIAVDSGAQAITVHGRTRAQFYNGTACWKAIARVREAISVPLTVNGDIVDLDCAHRALKASGADAVMVGRGSYGQPWLPAQIQAGLDGAPTPEFSAETVRELIGEHYALMLEHYGVETGLRAARKHLVWYLERLLPDPVRLAVQPEIVTCEEPSQVMQLMGAALTEIDDQGIAA